MTDFVADLPAYRAALAAAVAGPAYDPWRGRHHPSTAGRVADHALLTAQLHREGWNRYGWPENVGGLGGDERHRAILFDELSLAGLPVPEQHIVIETLGKPVLRFAPHLSERYMPDYLRGELIWGQGFSEPEAGSDLASLRCRAVADGDTYVVNGQKIWTSHGASATHLVCLVRTGTAEERHRGLTMIMIDASSPGVTIRPIALASGYEELAEVFFDDVVVPAGNVIGKPGGGWAVAMYLLQFERAQYAWQMSGVMLRHLRELRDTVARRPLPDGATRRFGEVYADVVALRARSSATVRRLAAGETVGPEASVDKVLLAAAEIGVYDLARDLLSGEFEFAPTPLAEQWRADWWYSRSATILGGSSEVQRTILADHVLGLPAERAR